jgi:hypothetical protein
MKYLVIADRHAGTDPAPYAEFTDPAVFFIAVLILEAESLEEAELAMGSLAMARNGLLDLTHSALIVPT